MTTVQRRYQSDPAPTLENIMLDTLRLYFEATVAVAIMAMFAIISGFASAGLTGDRRLAFLVAAAAFVLTGIVPTVRLWRMTRTPIPPPEPPT
jgi:hypothetical protein